MGFVTVEKLDVYRLAERLADEVWGMASQWRGLARDTVGKQLIRAADSVGANIAEGAGRGTHPDNRRCLRISRGSLVEVRFWLRRAYARKFLSAKDVQQIRPLLDRLGPKLNAYMNSIGRRIAVRAPRSKTPNTKNETP